MNVSSTAASKTVASERSQETGDPKLLGVLRYPLLLTIWTLFVWGGRVRNVATDDSLTGWPQVWRGALALSFVSLGLLVAVLLARALLQRTSHGAGSPMIMLRRCVTLLALYSIAVWSVRGVDIALGEHELAFKVVHTVLAAVTIGLGIAVMYSYIRWFRFGTPA